METTAQQIYEAKNKVIHCLNDEFSTSSLEGTLDGRNDDKLNGRVDIQKILQQRSKRKGISPPRRHEGGSVP